MGLSLLWADWFIPWLGTEESRARISKLWSSSVTVQEETLTSRSFGKIGSKFSVPSRAIMACFVFNLLFGLLYLGKIANSNMAHWFPFLLTRVTRIRTLRCIQCVHRKHNYFIECLICSPHFYTFDSRPKNFESRGRWIQTRQNGIVLQFRGGSLCGLHILGKPTPNPQSKHSLTKI